MAQVDFKINDVRREAERLNKLGYLNVRWVSDSRPEDRFPIERGIVIGFAIDSEDRDCFLMRCTNRADQGKFVIRCIPARQIVLLEVPEKKSRA